MVDTKKVAALMTAESIIIGFLLAYASLANERVVSLKDAGKPVLTTVFAGLLIYLLVLTAFRSLLLLFSSIDMDIRDLHDVRCSDERYRVGYDLFWAIVVGSSVYGLVNVVSILNYAATGDVMPILYEREATAVLVFFFVLGAEVVLFFPQIVSRCVGRVRGWFGLILSILPKRLRMIDS